VGSQVHRSRPPQASAPQQLQVEPIVAAAPIAVTAQLGVVDLLPSPLARRFASVTAIPASRRGWLAALGSAGSLSRTIPVAPTRRAVAARGRAILPLRSAAGHKPERPPTTGADAFRHARFARLSAASKRRRVGRGYPVAPTARRVSWAVSWAMVRFILKPLITGHGLDTVRGDEPTVEFNGRFDSVSGGQYARDHDSSLPICNHDQDRDHDQQRDYAQVAHADHRGCIRPGRTVICRGSRRS
jgi:hypothetical protein